MVAAQASICRQCPAVVGLRRREGLFAGGLDELVRPLQAVHEHRLGGLVTRSVVQDDASGRHGQKEDPERDREPGAWRPHQTGAQTHDRTMDGRETEEDQVGDDGSARDAVGVRGEGHQEQQRGRDPAQRDESPTAHQRVAQAQSAQVQQCHRGRSQPVSRSGRRRARHRRYDESGARAVVVPGHDGSPSQSRPKFYDLSEYVQSFGRDRGCAATARTHGKRAVVVGDHLPSSEITRPIITNI